jgi:hypothetical protein
MDKITRYWDLCTESDRLLAESKRLFREAEGMGVDLVASLGLPPAPPPQGPVGSKYVPPLPRFKRGPWSAEIFVTLHRFPEHGLAVGEPYQLWAGAFAGWVLLDLREESKE